MTTFITGRAGSGKTHYVISQMKKEQGELVLLVPEQYSHTTEKLLCTLGGNNISAKAEVLNFKRLADRIFMQAGGYANKVLDNGSKILIMHRALSKVRGELKALFNMAMRPEFLQSLIDMVEEIKTCSVSYDALLNVGEGTLSEKLHDIALIATAYDGEFKNGELDPAGRLDLAIERAKEIGFFKGKKLWIDGYTGFSQKEIELLRVAFAQSEKCTITLCLNDDPEGENCAFASAWDTYTTLSRIAGESEILRLDQSVKYKNNGLKHLEKNLYLPASESIEAEGIEIYEAGNAYNECEIAAARILELVRDGYRFRDIAVCAREFEEYSGILSAVFDRYGVPVYENKKRAVQELAPTAFVLNALKVVAEGFKYEDMAAYLKTGLSGVRRKNLDILEQYLYTWHIEGKEWTSGDNFSKNPSGRNETPTEEDLQKLNFLNRLRRKVASPLLRLRDNIKNDSTGIGYAKALFDFFEDTKLAKRLEARGILYRGRGEVYRAEEYESIWKLLISAIESIAEALGEEKFKLDEFINLFTLVLSQYEIGMIPTALDRVNVGSFERLGEAPIKCTIVLGAIDGRLPMYSAGKGILSDAEREKLLQMGIKLSKSAEKRLNDEFKLIYEALTAASERLEIIVPHVAPDGSETRDSFIIQRIESLFTNVKKKKFESPELFAKSPCFDMAASKSPNLWRSAAREYFANDEEYALKLELAEKNARVPRGPLRDKENIDAIFGKNIKLSSGRTDVFNSCRYQYFLKYGLYLNPKYRATFDALEAGTFTHAVLEQALKEIKARGGHKSVSDEEVYEIADIAIEKYIDEKLGGFKARSARFCAQFKRLKESARKVVMNAHTELKESLFQPMDFELHFSDKEGDLPALTIKGDDYTAKLEGFVDRVDAYNHEGTLYVRVVDYKTGKKEFKLNEVLNGLNMQMLLYLFTICELGEKRYDKRPEAAGVLYIPANDPMCKLDKIATKEEIEKKNLDAIKRKGILLDKNELYSGEKFLPISFDKEGNVTGKNLVSAEDFEKISKRLRDIIDEMGSEIAKGNIDANPYQTTDRTACKYCEMRSACHFDEREGDSLRELCTVKLEDITDGR